MLQPATSSRLWGSTLLKTLRNPEGQLTHGGTYKGNMRVPLKGYYKCNMRLPLKGFVMRSTGFPKGPSNGIVYTFGAQIPTTMHLDPLALPDQLGVTPQNCLVSLPIGPKVVPFWDYLIELIEF